MIQVPHRVRALVRHERVRRLRPEVRPPAGPGGARQGRRLRWGKIFAEYGSVCEGRDPRVVLPRAGMRLPSRDLQHAALPPEPGALGQLAVREPGTQFNTVLKSILKNIMKNVRQIITKVL